MPRASVYLVRAALLHLLLGSTLGALLLVAKAAPGLALVSWRWRPAHAELLAVGFTLQLAIGVATWILPRDADEPPGMAPAWAALLLLNAGVAALSFGSALEIPALALLGRILEAGAVATFAARAWPRVRAARIPT